MVHVLAPFLALRNTMFLVSATALLLAMAIAVLLGRGATRPIGQLVSAARRIEDGQYDAPVAVEGSEEFRRLAVTLNAMQDRVAECEARLRQQAYHDDLTGLPNRTLAEIELGRMLKETGAGRVTAIVVHLTNLRELNASLGHAVADEALRETARRLAAACRPGELVARLGASRYLVLVNRGVPVQNVPRVAKTTLGAVRERITIDQAEVELQATIPSLAQLEADLPKWFTFFGNDPSFKSPDRTLDYLLYSEELRIVNSWVRQNGAKDLSDHFPVIAEFILP